MHMGEVWNGQATEEDFEEEGKGEKEKKEQRYAPGIVAWGEP